MIEQREKEKMLRAHSTGPKMVRYLGEIDIALGRRHMNLMGVAALKNLIELAERES